MGGVQSNPGQGSSGSSSLSTAYRPGSNSEVRSSRFGQSSSPRTAVSVQDLEMPHNVQFAFLSSSVIVMDTNVMYESKKRPKASVAWMKHLATLTLERDASSLGLDEDENDCLICFNEYTKGNTLVSLQCGHTYHKHCLAEWFTRQATCPYCRYQVPKEPSFYRRGKQKWQHSCGTGNFCGSKRLLVERLREKQEQLQLEELRVSLLDRLSFAPHVAISEVASLRNPARSTPTRMVAAAISA